MAEPAPQSFPPGPTASPLRQTLQWFYRPLAYLEAARREHGEVFSVMFLGFKTPMVLFSDPAAVKAVYSKPANTLPPGRNLVLEPLLGSRSVLLLEGKEHLARRKLMLPAFHGEHMRAYEETIRDAIDREIESWPAGEPFPIHPRMQAVTLEVILRAVFGVEGGQRLTELRELLARVLGQVSGPIAQLLGLATRRLGRYGPYGRFEVLMEKVDAALLAEIADRRRAPDLAERDDILSSLLVATFEDGTGMEDREVRDQLMTLLLAGHETTATALAWTFDMLIRNPAPAARLTEEVRSGEDDAYLKATITEALRLRPVVPIAGRRLAEPLEVDGFPLDAGTDVTPAIWLTHTRPDLYPDPYDFRPERFLEDGPETYGWIPFGGGVRRCLGAAFAEFEMKIVLTEVLRRCDLQPGAAQPERVGRRNVTLSPAGGTPVIVKPRVPAREPVPA